ncbi:MAG: sugar ABC transporter permease [Chloroflexaceae bacterium]|jgi:multiple sugar transport system permease protein|nr:sugar ABC transporter permease [Chloroflexaceae bacterium]
MRVNKIYPYLLVAPAMLLIAAVSLYPTLYSLWLSLQRFRRGVASFGGLTNYQFLVTDDNFWNALRVTLIFGVFFVLITMVFSFVLALVFNRRLRFGPLYMTIIFIPWMLSEVVSGIMFLWIFNFGIADALVAPFFGEGYQFLASPVGAMGVIILATVWRSLAFAMLIVLAGLQTVSREIYEAAGLDGANRWQTFWQITWPLLLPTTTVTILLLSIQAVNATGMFLSITRGGPGRSTEALSLYMYNQVARPPFDFGYGAAISVVMFLLNMALAIFYIRTLRRESTTAAA